MRHLALRAVMSIGVLTCATAVGLTTASTVPQDSGPGRIATTPPTMRYVRTTAHLIPVRAGNQKVIDTDASSAPDTVSHSNNWAGYDKVVSGSFTDAVMHFTAPRPTSSGGAVSIWPGIGSGSNSQHDLAQAGVEEDVTAHSVGGFFWYEIYPYNPGAISVDGLSVFYGDRVGVEVKYLGSHRFGFYFWDYTTGKYTSKAETAPHPQLHQAETITERPTEPNGHVDSLAHFGHVSVSEAKLNGHCLAYFPADRYDMYSGSTLLATSHWNSSSGCAYTTERK